MKYFNTVDGERVYITKSEYEALVQAGGAIFCSKDELGIIDSVGETPDVNRVKTQAKQYLLSTDFKAVNGTLTPEQEAKRAKAKIVLDGSFVEPPSDLFDV